MNPAPQGARVGLSTRNLTPPSLTLRVMMFDLPANLLWTLVTPDQVWGFVLTTCRVFGCLQFAPITSEPSIPFRVRLMLAAVMGWLIASITPFSVSNVIYPLPLVAILELALGAAMGLGATLILMGLRGAADLIDQQSGLAMARILDPQLNEEATPHAPLLWLAGIAVFVLLAPIGGDLLLVGDLLETFQVMPIGLAEPAAAIDLLVSALIGSCKLAIGVAAPILIMLSLINWGIALWQRAEPSMNHGSWLLPVRMAALWLMLGWSAGMLPSSIDHAFGESGADVHTASQQTGGE